MELGSPLPSPFDRDPEVKKALARIGFTKGKETFKAVEQLKTTFTEERIDGYILFIAEMVYKQAERKKNSDKPVKNMGALFGSILVKGTQLENYKQKLKDEEAKAEEAKKKAEEDKQKLEVEMKKQLEKIHTDKDRNKFCKWVVNTGEQVFVHIEELSKEKESVRRLFLKGINEQTVAVPAKQVILYTHAEKLGFEKSSFDLDKYLNDPAHEEDRKQALKEAEKIVLKK